MEEIEIQLEGVLTVKKGGELLAVGYNDIKKRSNIFFTCKEMGIEDIKNLMQTISTKEKEVEIKNP